MSLDISTSTHTYPEDGGPNGLDQPGANAKPRGKRPTRPAKKGKPKRTRKSKVEPIINPVKVAIHRVVRDEKGNIKESTSRVVTMPRALFASKAVQDGLPFDWANQKVTIF